MACCRRGELRDPLFGPKFLHVLTPEGTRTLKEATFVPKWAQEMREEMTKLVGDEEKPEAA